MADSTNKILETLKDYIRVNDADKTVEIYDDYGVKMKLPVDAETLKAFKAEFRSF